MKKRRNCPNFVETGKKYRHFKRSPKYVVLLSLKLNLHESPPLERNDITLLQYPRRYNTALMPQCYFTRVVSIWFVFVCIR